MEEISIREDRTYNIRPRHLCKVTGANITSPLRGVIIGLGMSYRKACDITLTAGKATGQLYPRDVDQPALPMSWITTYSLCVPMRYLPPQIPIPLLT